MIRYLRRRSIAILRHLVEPRVEPRSLPRINSDARFSHYSVRSEMRAQAPRTYRVTTFLSLVNARRVCRAFHAISRILLQKAHGMAHYQCSTSERSRNMTYFGICHSSCNSTSTMRSSSRLLSSLMGEVEMRYDYTVHKDTGTHISTLPGTL